MEGIFEIKGRMNFSGPLLDEHVLDPWLRIFIFHALFVDMPHVHYSSPLVWGLGGHRWK